MKLSASVKQCLMKPNLTESDKSVVVALTRTCLLICLMKSSVLGECAELN
jgi:hypothetical protein